MPQKSLCGKGQVTPNPLTPGDPLGDMYISGVHPNPLSTTTPFISSKWGKRVVCVGLSLIVIAILLVVAGHGWTDSQDPLVFLRGLVKRIF